MKSYKKSLHHRLDFQGNLSFGWLRVANGWDSLIGTKAAIRSESSPCLTSVINLFFSDWDSSTWPHFTHSIAILSFLEEQLSTRWTFQRANASNSWMRKFHSTQSTSHQMGNAFSWVTTSGKLDFSRFSRWPARRPWNVSNGCKPLKLDKSETFFNRTEHPHFKHFRMFNWKKFLRTGLHKWIPNAFCRHRRGLQKYLFCLKIQDFVVWIRPL